MTKQSFPVLPIETTIPENLLRKQLMRIEITTDDQHENQAFNIPLMPQGPQFENKNSNPLSIKQQLVKV